MTEPTRGSIIKKLKEKGLKATLQGLAIIETFIEKGELHPGAKLIYEEARKKSM